MFPLVYTFLPNKTTMAYKRFFNLLKERACSLELQLQPTNIIGDFELAIQQPVLLTFPLANFQGCYYHFCQVLLRKVQTLGLQVQYQEQNDLKSFIRKTAAFSFIPARFVRLAWQEIKAETPEFDRIDEFVLHFERS